MPIQAERADFSIFPFKRREQSIIFAPSFLYYGLHDIGRRPLVEQFVLHVIHVRGHMFKKCAVTFAQVVQSRFTGGRGQEPVFRALTVTCEEVGAQHTLRG